MDDPHGKRGRESSEPLTPIEMQENTSSGGRKRKHSMLLPTAVRSDDKWTQVRRWLWYITFCTTYTNVTIMVLNNTVNANKLPAWWRNNRAQCENVNWIMFLVGFGTFLPSTIYHTLYLRVIKRKQTKEKRWEGKSKTKWSRLAGKLWTVSWLMVMLSIPYVIYYMFEIKDAPVHEVAFNTALVLTVLTTIFSFREIIKHIMYYHQPELQRHIVRILLMPVIYSVDCLLSLRYIENDALIHLLREQYEAYTVWSFMGLMMEFLTKVAKHREHEGSLRALEAGTLEKSKNKLPHFQNLPQFKQANKEFEENEALIVRLLENEEENMHAHHMFPLCWMGDWKMGAPFLRKCRSGVLQYVAYSSTMSIINFILELCGLFHEGDLSFQYGYVYVMFIRNMSQLWALYCLVLFYHGTNTLLKPIHPLPKFLAIKLVVFFTFWQALAIDLFESWHWLDFIPDLSGTNHLRNDTMAGSNNTHPEHVLNDHMLTDDVLQNTANVSVGLQDLLVCFEMFVAAVLHKSIFTYKAHRPDTTDIMEAKAAGSKHDMLVSLISHIEPDDYDDSEAIRKAKEVILNSQLRERDFTKDQYTKVSIRAAIKDTFKFDDMRINDQIKSAFGSKVSDFTEKMLDKRMRDKHFSHNMTDISRALILTSAKDLYERMQDDGMLEHHGWLHRESLNSIKHIGNMVTQVVGHTVGKCWCLLVTMTMAKLQLHVSISPARLNVSGEGASEPVDLESSPRASIGFDFSPRNRSALGSHSMSIAPTEPQPGQPPGDLPRIRATTSVPETKTTHSEEHKDDDHLGYRFLVCYASEHDMEAHTVITLQNEKYIVSREEDIIAIKMKHHHRMHGASTKYAFKCTDENKVQDWYDTLSRCMSQQPSPTHSSDTKANWENALTQARASIS